MTKKNKMASKSIKNIISVFIPSCDNIVTETTIINMTLLQQVIYYCCNCNADIH